MHDAAWRIGRQDERFTLEITDGIGQRELNNAAQKMYAAAQQAGAGAQGAQGNPFNGQQAGPQGGQQGGQQGDNIQDADFEEVK